jgi:hypothetical protein
VHPYINASAECWELFGMLQTLEMERFGYPRAHRVVVDAYAAQHPGDGTDRRDRQSVVVHLTSLCLLTERGADPSYAASVLRRMTSDAGRDFPMPERLGPGELDLRHAWEAESLESYERRAREWGQAVWASYAPAAHATVRAALDAVAER